jgi:hypothetical protein
MCDSLVTGVESGGVTYRQTVWVFVVFFTQKGNYFLNPNPLKAELSPICHLLALLGAHHILHVSGLRVNGVCSGCFGLPKNKRTIER